MKVSDIHRPYVTPKNPARHKARLNITVDAELLAAAKAKQLPLSALMEEKIVDVLRSEQNKQWREDNAEAIRHHDERLRKDGLWSDGLRPW